MPQSVFVDKENQVNEAVAKPAKTRQASNHQSTDSQKPEYFVLRAKSKELLLKMYDTDPESLAILKELKRQKNGSRKRDKGRSKFIR